MSEPETTDISLREAAAEVVATLRDGLCDFVWNVMCKSHTSLLKEVADCHRSQTSNVQTTKNARDDIISRLTACHRWNSLCFANLEDSTKLTKYWEVIKLFLPENGYKDKNAIDELDAGGLLYIICTCTFFDPHVSVDLKDSENVYRRVTKMERELLCCRDRNVTEKDLRILMKDVEEILSDIKNKSYTDKPKMALQELRRLEQKVNNCRDFRCVREIQGCRSSICQLENKKEEETIQDTSVTFTELNQVTSMAVLKSSDGLVDCGKACVLSTPALNDEQKKQEAGGTVAEVEKNSDDDSNELKICEINSDWGKLDDRVSTVTKDGHKECKQNLQKVMAENKIIGAEETKGREVALQEENKKKQKGVSAEKLEAGESAESNKGGELKDSMVIICEKQPEARETSNGEAVTDEEVRIGEKEINKNGAIDDIQSRVGTEENSQNQEIKHPEVKSCHREEDTNTFMTPVLFRTQRWFSYRERYSDVDAREKSFEGTYYAEYSTQLARAGYYYDYNIFPWIYGQPVRCFSCGEMYGRTELFLDGDLAIQHAFAAPTCSYIKELLGEDIVEVISKDCAHHSVAFSSFIDINTPLHINALDTKKSELVRKLNPERIFTEFVKKGALAEDDMAALQNLERKAANTYIILHLKGRHVHVYENFMEVLKKSQLDLYSSLQAEENLQRTEKRNYLINFYVKKLLSKKSIGRSCVFGSDISSNSASVDSKEALQLPETVSSLEFMNSVDWMKGNGDEFKTLVNSASVDSKGALQPTETVSSLEFMYSEDWMKGNGDEFKTLVKSAQSCQVRPVFAVNIKYLISPSLEDTHLETRLLCFQLFIETINAVVRQTEFLKEHKSWVRFEGEPVNKRVKTGSGRKKTGINSKFADERQSHRSRGDKETEDLVMSKGQTLEQAHWCPSIQLILGVLVSLCLFFGTSQRKLTVSAFIFALLFSVSKEENAEKATRPKVQILPVCDSYQIWKRGDYLTDVAPALDFLTTAAGRNELQSSDSKSQTIGWKTHALVLISLRSYEDSCRDMPARSKQTNCSALLTEIENAADARSSHTTSPNTAKANTLARIVKTLLLLVLASAFKFFWVLLDFFSQRHLKVTTIPKSCQTFNSLAETEVDEKLDGRTTTLTSEAVVCMTSTTFVSHVSTSVDSGTDFLGQFSSSVRLIETTNLVPGNGTEADSEDTQTNTNTVVVLLLRTMFCPWGGETEEFRLYNTCPLDNFLQMMYILQSTVFSLQATRCVRDWLASIQDGHGIASTLLEVASLFSNKRFTYGKLLWISQTRPSKLDGSSHDINLKGTEEEWFVEHYASLQQTKCTNRCGRAHDNKIEDQIILCNSPGKVGLQDAINRWWNCLELQQDCLSCTERNTWKRSFDVLQAPWVLIVNIRLLDVPSVSLGETVTIGNIRYSVFGITRYHNGHFTTIFAIRGETFLYDGHQQIDKITSPSTPHRYKNGHMFLLKEDS